MFKKESLIRQKTVGEFLSGTRLAQRKHIAVIAEKLKIPAHYLEALEKGRYNTLPSPVYIRNYLRLYAKELRIPWARISAQYDKEIRVYQQTVRPDQATAAHKRHVPMVQPAGASAFHAHQQPLMIMRWLKMIGTCMVAVLAMLYLGTQLEKLLEPPELVVFSPERDMIVREHSVSVTGKTRPEALVEINGQRLSLEPDGQFHEDVPLHRGVNTIRISAKSKLSRERVETRTILYHETE